MEEPAPLITDLPDHAIISTAELAQRLRRSKSSLEKWRAAGEGPSYRRFGTGRRGGRIEYEVRDVNAWWQDIKVNTPRR